MDVSVDKHAPIAIVGAGCWGLSTAYHLVKAGYDNITVFDRASVIPSPYSAADDLNKIIRAQYDDDFWTDLGLRALAAWKTPDWAPYYHQTGHLVTVSGHAPAKATSVHNAAELYASAHPTLSQAVTRLRTTDDIRQHGCWQLSGPLTGFHGYFNRAEGYAHSADALKGIATLLAGKGVRFYLGESQGHVIELVYSTTTTALPRRCTGLRTAARKHAFTRVICALGAYGASLVPDLGHFNVARCWSVAHVQLTARECALLRGIPIVNVRDLGFFFEPDPETGLLKLTPLGAGFSNFERTGAAVDGRHEAKGASRQGHNKLDPKISLPPAQAGVLDDYVPLEDERKMRLLLRETLPWLAEREFVRKKMCWFSDTVDSEYCIDFVPGTEGSVVVLSGDSGHGFKMMPIFGEWVVELLGEGRQVREAWRWRGDAVQRARDEDDGPGSVGTDWGSDVSWRFGEAKEIGEIVKERERMARARL